MHKPGLYIGCTLFDETTMPDAYQQIRDMILENEEDVALLKRVNRLTFGLMISKEPEIKNNNFNNEET